MKILVDGIYLASPKAKGNKKPHTTRKIVNGIINVLESESEESITIKTYIETSQFTCKLLGVMDKANNTFKTTIIEESTRSYLKKKKFYFIGYTLEASRANV